MGHALIKKHELVGGGKMRIGLNELPKDFRVVLRRPFLQRLLLEGKHRVGLWKKLADELGLDYTTLVEIRNGEIKSISAGAIRILASITGIALEEMEKNCVCALRAQSKAVKIPIYQTPELASLVAHALGDGSISEGHFQVEYKNKDIGCIQDVLETVRAIFDVRVPVTKNERDIYIATLPATVGQVLCMAGSIRGNKTERDFDVPQWIKSGDREIKKSFLQSLLDDEGSVYTGSKSSCIKLFMGKSASQSNSLHEFLNSVQNMLRDFGIRTGKARVFRKYKVKNKEKIMLGFWITGKRNLKLFAKEIGFKHLMKRKKLEIAIKSYKHDIYNEEVRDEILRILHEKGPKRTCEINKILKKDRAVTLRHLHKLENNQKVSFSLYKPAKGSFAGFLWCLKTDGEVKR